ncbi:YdcF family protein [Pararhizobium sp. YC-54]|uniref:YdcF family protein n=1 Tax=Pararhizobium sp. YC-54 TaxID=2986920 RepID=UPI0021F73481|nr:YdcF family protein [Pararhizobium sp. YC-54]MCW0001301.1 YdcF family protein [Pararhizobium sp. YC-54]
MFLASKLFWLLAQPLSLVFLLLILSFLLAAAGFRRPYRFLSGLAATLLFLILFTSTGAVVLQGLENRILRPATLPAGLSCIIILGGSFENEVIAKRGGMEFNQAADRFVEGLKLAQSYPSARILVSGGDGSFSGQYDGDARTSKTFFSTFGVAPERLIRDDRSRTTFENAANTKQLLEANGLSNCALITSAFHMPRSVGLFRKLGIAVTPWPVDYRTSGELTLGLDFSQPALNAQLTTTALREWTGLIAYFIGGRTHVLFPQ